MLRILIPLDGSALAERALQHAKAIARVFPAELTLLRVIGDTPLGATGRTDIVDFALQRHQVESYLKKLRIAHVSAGIPIKVAVAEGLAAEAITQYCADQHPDLIVLTRYGAGDASKFAAGGTVQKVVANTDCSVLLIDPRNDVGEPRYRRILVPVDDTRHCEYALALAGMIARGNDASLLLLHVTEEPQLAPSVSSNRHASHLIKDMRRLMRQHAEHRLKELCSTLPDAMPVRTQLLVSPDVPSAIDAAANSNDSDLVLVCANSTNPGNGWRYGAVVHALLQYSHRSLLIVQPPTDCRTGSNFRSAFLTEPRLHAG